MAGWGGNLVLDAPTRSLLHGFPGGDGRAIESDMKGEEWFAALVKTAAVYDRFPLSHAKKVIRVASLEEWQERYAKGSTGEIIKCFFPRVEKAYRILRIIEMTSHVAQTLTCHSRFAQYLFRFRLRDSPHCACDPVKTQNVLHVLEDCDMFLGEHAALKAGDLRPNLEAALSGNPGRHYQKREIFIVLRHNRKTML
ncbi:hypothetical protein EVAR_25518_1 [Eumeta japonica]|uniref:Retrovirus-related Pol polyprotein from type-1 retrotransposable element R1 3 n=1 Tax=Eumeta variegata TaxID=151549 RepID=A0A4C1VPA3_EUMVA|nr:hypothetical protein EVAR_25518_1 [Eumeta japonica]